jgi:uncharacterized protein YkwD
MTATPATGPVIRYSDRKRRSLCQSLHYGVFISTRDFFQLPQLSPSSSLPDLEASEHSTLPETTPPVSWKSAGSTGHNNGAPLLVNNPDTNEPILDQAECLGKILVRSRRLPQTGHYSSNHVMVNQERIKRNAAPLIRMRELDELARVQAQAMAKRGSLFHAMSPQQVRESLQDRPCRRLGENVAKGKTIREMHQSMMETTSQKNNIMDRRFTHMGMGTAAHAADGDLYMCQLFRG